MEYTIVLIRHGLTEANRKQEYLGRRDVPLCAEGEEALRRLFTKGAVPPAELLFASPMLRAVQSAGLLYPELKPVLLPEFMETDFGSYEGKTWRELKNDPAYQAWIDSGGRLDFPTGESREAFSSRVRCGFRKVCECAESAAKRHGEAQDTGRHPTAAVITHGGVIMQIMAELFPEDTAGDPFRWMPKNGEIFTIRFRDGRPEITEHTRQDS